MKKYKKVTYTLEKSIVDVIHKRSLFENIPQSQLVSFYIQNGYSLMVDEYKDTNTAQFKFVSLFAEKYKNICVVGDDDHALSLQKPARHVNAGRARWATDCG